MRSQHVPNPTEADSIAVIGMSCIFPQDASSPEGFWKMLVEGRSARTKIPEDRFNSDAFYHSATGRAGTVNVQHGHFLKDDVTAFDAPFFSISSQEASGMDPQQRALLETTYHALENAGIPINNIKGTNTAVYIGSAGRDFELIGSKDIEQMPTYFALGAIPSIQSNRLSWFFDLRGPSMTVDTACSGSMQCLYLGAQSLLNGECDMVITGGSNLILTPELTISLSNFGFLSPDGKCHSFDHRANGYARGEGHGIIILKRLSDAIQDGNTIRAVIRAVASNQDGRTSVLARPSRDAHVSLIRSAYLKAGISFNETRFFEAHGTGTAVGDPIEAGGISDIFKEYRTRDEPLYVGATKSNIGHLEGASAIAGVIKAVLAVEKGIIPPNVWLEKVNPEIKEDWNLEFPTKALRWPAHEVRRVSVNSFGAGGANAHVIIDDAYNYLRIRGLSGRHRSYSIEGLHLFKPNNVDVGDSIGNISMFPTGTGGIELCKPHTNDQLEIRGQPGLLSETQKKQHLHRRIDSSMMTEISAGESQAKTLQVTNVFVFSSADEGGIERLSIALGGYLASGVPKTAIGQTFLDELAYTLSRHRSMFPWKSYLVASSVEELTQKLSAKQYAKPVRSTGMAPLVFVFTGQGAQWATMGRELLVHPAFRESFEAAEAFLLSLGYELNRPSDKSNIHLTEYSQALCTLLQVALVDLLRSWKIHPKAVVGHSSGEIAAAYCAGGLDRESAWRVAYYRGKVSAILEATHNEQGAMLAVPLNEPDIANIITTINENHMISGTKLTVACNNGPKSITISGSSILIDLLQKALEDRDIQARKVRVTIAYHSKQMQVVAEQYRTFIRDIPIPPDNGNSPATEFFSSLHGAGISLDIIRQSSYWVDNLTSKVQFAEAVQAIGLLYSNRKEAPLFVEIGPHPALRKPVMDTMASCGWHSTYSSILQRNLNGLHQLATFLGILFQNGYTSTTCPIDSAPLGVDLQMLTDLPSYPFNHSRSYSAESRLSRDFRTKRVPRNVYLGTRAADWNPAEPRWRNFISLVDHPWTQDHQFNDTVLYPGAGIAIMAVEAARHLTSVDKHIRNIEVREINFSNPIVLSDQITQAEVHVHLKLEKEDEATTEYSFNIYRVSPESVWETVSSGRVAVELSHPSLDDRTGPKQDSHHFAGVQNQLHPKAFYNTLSSYGLSFGPAFQLTKRILYDFQKISFTEVRQSESEDVHTNHSFTVPLIHPTILDAIMQAGLVVLATNQYVPNPNILPTHIRQIWLSDDLKDLGSHSLDVYCKTTFIGFREAEFSILAKHGQTGKPLVQITGYRVTSIVTTKSETRDVVTRDRTCYKMQWKPDWSVLSREATERYLLHRRLKNVEDRRIADIELCCLYFMCSTASNSVTSTKSHLHRYHQWAKKQLLSEHARSVLAQPEAQRMFLDFEFREDYLRDLERCPGGKMSVAIGRNLSRILDEAMDPLELLFSEHTPLAQEYYQGPECAIAYDSFSTYLDSLAHRNPNMDVIEIGAGTGGATRHVLSTLAPTHSSAKTFTPRFSTYVFTDISPSFFSGAQKEFEAFDERMTFKTLDISRDPNTQGFQQGQYDLIVASNVLHATEDISATLQNTRKLLKPGGKLVAIELSNPEAIHPAFTFALLPGWWMAKEQSRQWSPALTQEGWHDALLQSGFSGTDVYVRDYDGPDHSGCLIVSTAAHEKTPDEAPQSSVNPIVLIADIESNMQQSIAIETMQHFSAKGHQIQLMTFEESSSDSMTSDRIYVFLSELDRPLLVDMKQKEYDCLKSATQCARSILWVVSEGLNTPTFGLIQGLAHTVYSERPVLGFTSLSIDDTSSVSHVSAAIQQVLSKVICDDAENAEVEYMLRDGILYIDRIIEDEEMNDKLYHRKATQAPSIQQVEPKSMRQLRMTIGSPGILDTLHFEDDPRAGSPLGEHDIEVDVHGAALSVRDSAVILGQTPGNFIGLQCSGVVSRVGSSVSNLQTGHRVACVSRESFSSYARCNEHAALILPDSVDLHDGASIFVNYLVAYSSLAAFANLQRNQIVLVHDGASSLGQAALQVCRMKGAVVFTTVSCDEEKRTLKDELGIQEADIISTNAVAVDLAERVLASTGDQRVHIAFGSFSSIELVEISKCVQPMGKLIDIRYGIDNVALTNLPKMPSVSFISTTVEELVDYSLENGYVKFLPDIFSGLEPGTIVPAGLQRYKASDIETAVRSQQGNQASGLCIVQFTGDDTLRMMPKTPAPLLFDPMVSYVIAGAFGGLGRSISRWVADKGAKNLILLSRSGGSSVAATTLLAELHAKGVKVMAPKCDISDEQSMSENLRDCKECMPAIKGCFQCAMVLKDSLFENMSLEDFNAALRPKVTGSWNLHTYLPSDLDFFVMLSSSMGAIGNLGQSNYAAGNTYQDSLARYRAECGQHGISLGLGLITDVGFVAEHPDIKDRMLGAGYASTTESELHAMLESICADAMRDPAIVKSPDFVSGIMTGLTTHSTFEKRSLAPFPMMARPLFRHLWGMDRQTNTGLANLSGSAQMPAADLLRDAKSEDDAISILSKLLLSRVAKALFVPEVDIDLTRAASAQGVDSLVGVELRAWVKKELGVDLSIFDILQSQSLAAVASIINEKRTTIV
ncbi:hypothetical protein EJ05DRAFT_495835 [Pseudovirgaria hyperparasitica]|uniref:Uncharacterized protein n=1 Tax=Pseudovirgaria hyperparasitica TaxID=470096 RepID=A0A6A6WLA4_9PEZI|nr:uncharacterized protein EJ05DRAFT_495835 [Pseudovirgaria hyperparasitica]KAF2762994.1 hypothetical protein EJ05DRAFT_495835 [Pseudovirgaria hyperparasitica]